MYLKGLTFSMVEDKNSSLRSTPNGTVPGCCSGWEDNKKKRIATKNMGPKLSLSARTAFVSIMSPSTSLNS